MSNILRAVRTVCESNIQLHKANIDTFLANPVGVGEHIDFINPVISELEKMEKYLSILEVLEQYFE